MGATQFSDFVSIHCARSTSCAIRANGDAYCWGDWTGLVIEQPPVLGPWAKIQGFSWARKRDSFYGNTSFFTYRSMVIQPTPKRRAQ